MFADRLNILRKQQNLTQSELAKKINVAPSTVGMWERSHREPDIDMLIKLANYFNIDINFLLGISNDRTPPGKKENNRNATSSKENVYSKDEQSLVESYRALNEEGQEKIIDYVDDLMTSGKYIKSGQLGMAE